MRASFKAVANQHAHVGFAYNRFVPGTTAEKADWLKQIECTSIDPDYRDHFERWQASFTGPDSRTVTCKATSRLFVGHGNPSGSEVGLTVHHTWGAPIIPGSALKGVLAHHVASLYGGHERWRGVTWDGHRIAKGPGELYRTLFGAPDADDDPKNDPGARAGNVVFHDALYIPSSCAMDRPFARDILTVHHKPYYDKHGQTAPNDYEDPVPVGFLNVRPGACFLLALSGRADWTELALALLLEALRARGVGGKTSLGYGRLAEVAEDEVRLGKASEAVAIAPVDPPPSRRDRASVSDVVGEFTAALRVEGRVLREVLEQALADWPERLLALDHPSRQAAARKLQARRKGLRKESDKELERRVGEIVERLRGAD